MKATYSDEEIRELLSNAVYDWTVDVNIDERAFNFWFRDKYGMPYGTFDLKYARYSLRSIGFGDTSDDYWVTDSKNPFFSASLTEFLDMDEKGLLPVEATAAQYFRRKLKNILISVTTSAGVLLYIFVMLGYLI